MTLGKLKEKCITAIRKRPGILRAELYRLNIGHRSSVRTRVLDLVYERRVIQAWDKVMGSYRLYPYGKEPPIRQQKEHRVTLYQRHALYLNDVADRDFNKGHGHKFYMAFDEAFEILYIDLKILGMAAQEMLHGKTCC